MKFYYFSRSLVLVFAFTAIILAMVSRASGKGKDSLAVLQGGDTAFSEVGTAFKDPGLTFLKPVRKVSTHSDLNIHVLGIYHIVYIFSDSVNTDSLTRVVIVRDGVGPLLVLKGDVALSMCQYAVFEDAGYTVSDNYDSPKDLKIDISGTFKNTDKPGLYTLIYKATDKSGNISTIKYRYISVKNAGDPGCDCQILPDSTAHQPNSSITTVSKQNPEINIFPNPSSGLVHVLTDGSSLIKWICIENMQGQTLKTFKAGDLRNNLIDLKELPAGIYFAKIETSNGVQTQKLIISR